MRCGPHASVALFFFAGVAMAQAMTPAIARADGGFVAEFKGYVAINRVLGERLVRDGEKFELATYLDEHYFGGGLGDSLLDLLGGYIGASLDSSFRNGAPNVVNMLLWHVAFSGLAKDLGALCDPAGSSPLKAQAREELLAALKPVCAWPQPAARTDDALTGLWLAFMSFDAPMSEYEAWRDFFRGPAYAGASAQDAVAGMALAVFNNPYFLLKE